MVPSSPTHRQAPVRAPLACLACRTGKTRCTGLIPPDVLLMPTNKNALKNQPAIPAERPCPRCIQQGIPCLWKPCSRTGRPRKRQRSPSPVSDSPFHGATKKQEQTSPAPNLTDPLTAPPSPPSQPVPPTPELPQVPYMEPFDGFRMANWTAWELSALNSLWPAINAPQQTCTASPPNPASISGNASANLLQSLFWPTPDTFASIPAVSAPIVAPTTAPTATSAQSLVQSSPEPVMYQDWSSGSPSSTPITSVGDLSSLRRISDRSSSPGLVLDGTTEARSFPSADLAFPTPLPASLSHSSDPPTTTPSDAPVIGSPVASLQALTSSSTYSDPSTALETEDKSCCSLPLQQDPLRALHERIHAGGKPSGTPAPALGLVPDDETEKGVDNFFSSFALSLPMLGRQQDFMRWSERRLSTLAIAFLGHNCINGAEANVTAKALSRAESEWCCIVQGPDWSSLHSRPAHALDVLVSTLVLAYGHYGRYALAEAERYMKRFLELALACRLPQLDHPEARDAFVIWAHATGMDVSVRRLWAEFFAADVMMHISTSGKIKRQFVSTEHDPVRIDAASDVGFEQDPDDSDAAYRARTSVVKLMYECVCGHCMSPSGAPDLGRLASLDRVLQNLVSDSQQAWITCLRSPPTEANEHAGGSENRTVRMDALRTRGSRQAVLFDSLVAAHACRIHLHRRAWFGDLPLDLESCSFKWHGDAAPERPNISADRHNTPQHCYVPDPKAIQSSVQTIVEAADSIQLLTQLDSQRAFERVMVSEANPSDLHFMPIHWPVWGCCQMVAAYAYVVMVAAGASRSGVNVPAIGSNSLGVSGLSYGARIIGNTNGADFVPSSIDLQEWRKREAVNNMAFCEATLGHGSKVFPLYRLFRSELHRCRLAVDASVDHNLT